MKNQARLHSLPPKRGTVAWWLWLSCWLLIALLIADMVGAPFHRHHHDSGIDAVWSAAAHADGDHAIAHVEGIDHEDSFGHTTLAVRPTAESTVKPASITDAGPFALACIACLWTTLTVAIREDAGVGLPYANWQAPPIASYRSLPPAGRAPPLHA